VFSTQDQAALAAELETRLASFIDENRLPGGAAGVVCGDELTWSAGTGFADLATGKATDPAMLYGIASITQTFTGTAIMQLRDLREVLAQASSAGRLAVRLPDNILRIWRRAALPRLQALGQERAEPVQGPGVDHVVGGEPAALRGADAVRQVVQVGDGVGVAVDGELHPGVPGRADVVGRQVEPLRRGVDLQRRPGPRAGAEQLAEVHVDRRPAPHPAGGGVADDVHVRFSHAATNRRVISAPGWSKWD
jgi:Beta-lactamase